jgi:hypothetical protein
MKASAESCVTRPWGIARGGLVRSPSQGASFRAPARRGSGAGCMCSRPLGDGSAGTESEPVWTPQRRTSRRVVLSVEAVHSSEWEALDARPWWFVHRCWQAKSPAITVPSYRVTRSPSARMASRFLDPSRGRLTGRRACRYLDEALRSGGTRDPRWGEQSRSLVARSRGNPAFIVRGRGAHVFDADGRAFLDFVGSWGPLILVTPRPRLSQPSRSARRAARASGLRRRSR